ncbi:MAG: hypothetical protein Q9209_007734 [Squamulea sp. 1 TL-2023]
MLDGIDYEKPNVARQNWLFCGDNWLQWKQPTDIDELDTQDPKQTVGEIFDPFVFECSKESAWQLEMWNLVMFLIDTRLVGAFLAKVHTPLKSLNRYVIIPDANQLNPLCWGSNLACTLQNVRAITFCDPAFGYKKSLDKTKSEIQPGNHIRDKLTLAHMWIHEWGHLFNLFRDEFAVNMLGVPIDEHANGWQKAVNLARWDPNRARRAPDLYALFATAVYFDNYGWGNGVAEQD